MHLSLPLFWRGSAAGLTLLALASLSGCVYDRTGQSASGRLQADMKDARSRLTTSEERLAREGTRIDDLDQRSQAARKFLADSGANLQGLLQAVQDVQGGLSSLRQELQRTQTVSQDLDSRLLDLDTRLTSLEEQLASLPAGGNAKGGKTPTGKGAPPSSPPAAGTRKEGKTPESPPPSSPSGGVIIPIQSPPNNPSQPTPAAVPPSSVPPATSPAISGNDPPTADPTISSLSAEELLGRALLQVKEQKWSAGAGSLQSFVDRFPDNSRVGEARFFLAECLYNLKEYRLAVQRYQDFIDSHSSSPDVPRAMLRQGLSFIQMGGRDQKDAARLFFEDLIDRFPKSPEAAKAREELARMK